MVRTWVMMIGLTLLWVAACPGDEAFIGPPEQTGDAGAPGVPEDPGVVEPKPDPGYEPGSEVVGSEGGGEYGYEYEVVEPKPDPGTDVLIAEPVGDGEGGVIDQVLDGEIGGVKVKPDGEEIVYVKPDVADVVADSETLERDNRIYMMGTTDGTESTGLLYVAMYVSELGTFDTGDVMAAFQSRYASILAQTPQDAQASLGLLDLTGDGAAQASTEGPPNMTQVNAIIGQAFSAQAGIIAAAASSLPGFSSQVDNSDTQMPTSATQAFDALQTSGIVNPLPGW